MNITELEERVSTLTLFSFNLQHKMTSRNPGVFDKVVEEIEEVLNAVLGKISSSLSSVLDGIAAGLSGILNNIDTRLGEQLTSVKDGVENAINSVANVIDRFADTLEGAVDGIIEKVGGFFDRIVANLESAISGIVSSLGTITQQFTEALSETVEKIKDTFFEVLGTFAEWIDALITSLEKKLEGLTKALEELGKRIWESITETATALAEAVKEAWEVATESLKRRLSDLLEKLREAVEELRKGVTELYENILAYTNEHIVDPIKTGLEEGKELALFKGEVLTRVALGQYNSWEDFVDDISDPIPAIGAAGAVLGGLLLTLLIAPAASTAMAPALENLGHLAREKFRPTLLTEYEVINARFRNLLNDQTAGTELGFLGYRPERQKVLIESARPLLGPATIQMAYLRGEIDESLHDDLLSKHGYTHFDIAVFKTLYQLIPPPADLIQMAVKEAFSPEIAVSFGQYEDFPEAFGIWAEKQGLTKEWAERYWAAHWNLPSSTQGFEMLHRGVVDEDELKLLLRALDIMPFWKEKLIQISYRPYTRVDIRRMYGLGILDRDGVYRSYRDLGYDDEHAEGLTEFTVRYYTSEDETEQDDVKQLTRGVYMTARKKGLIDSETLMSALIGLGYTNEDALLLVQLAEAQEAIDSTEDRSLPRFTQTRNLIYASNMRGIIADKEALSLYTDIGISQSDGEWLVMLADYELDIEIRNTYLESVHAKYVERTYDRAEALKALGIAGSPGEEIKRLFTLWDVEREVRTRKPSEAQFRGALQRGIISVDEYMEELRGLGFDEKYVVILTQMAIK